MFTGELFGEYRDTRSEFEIALNHLQDPPSIYDIETGDDKLGLRFTDKSTIVLYGAFEANYANRIIEGKAKLKFGTKLYESLETVKTLLESPQNEKMKIVVFSVNVSNCLDLLDMRDLKTIKEFYTYGLKYKMLDKEKMKENPDIEVIEKFYAYNKSNGKQNFDTIRLFMSKGSPLYTKSSFKIVTYIEYIILDNKHIEVINHLDDL